MADDEGEDDDDDAGMPPSIPGMRIWTDPGGGSAMSGNSPVGGAVAGGPPTEEERRRFNIPDPSAPGARAAAPAGEISASATVLTALIAKFPDFSPSWPPEVQTVWFASFSRLMEAGLK